jgi:hypothetical protein
VLDPFGASGDGAQRRAPPPCNELESIACALAFALSFFVLSLLPLAFGGNADRGADSADDERTACELSGAHGEEQSGNHQHFHCRFSELAFSSR